MIEISHLVSCYALPLVPEQTTVPAIVEPITTGEPIVFSHDSNPFDKKSYSFQEGSNQNTSKPENSHAIHPMVKLSKVWPMQKPRQQRIHVFRPLFVYRQEQAMRRRATARPSIDPDRFYPSSYPYDPYYYYQHQHPDQHYANGYYPDYNYEPYPYQYTSDDYTPEYWYPYH